MPKHVCLYIEVHVICTRFQTGNTILVRYCFVSVVEKELKLGDHGYARRTRLPGTVEEDADRTAEDRQPCTQCHLLKKQLEQEMQHTARLQKEVGLLLGSLSTNDSFFSLKGQCAVF